jgi:predicted  nucleic acid-binding Zn-ribbon protein
VSDTFRPVFESMKQVADGLIQANEGIKKMADAVLDARDEHEDLKETIARLEGLIVAQGEDLRALRRRIEGTDH